MSWTVLYTTDNDMEAQIIVGRLESEGIQVFLQQEAAGDALGITVGELAEIRILVNDHDLERAQALLDTPAENISGDDDAYASDNGADGAADLDQ